MRRAARLVTGALGLLAVAGLTACQGDGARSTAYSAPTTTTTAAAPTTSSAPAGVPGNVAQIVDGDTFDLTDGTRVRVLGIDSCEAATTGGSAATAEATTLLLAGPVTLTAEPGVSTDKYGRALRYVGLSDGRDFGTEMVRATHTGLYEGSDASPSVVATLRAADTTGRTCGGATTTTAPPTTARSSDYSVPDDPTRPYVPAPDRPRSGHSGHPCLPGERDGDHDGYCGE